MVKIKLNHQNQKASNDDLSYPGGHWIVSMVLLPIVLGMVFLCIIAAWLKFDFLMGRIVLLLIISICVYILSKLIRYTTFRDRDLRIKYLFGNSKTMDYTDIRSVKLHQDGVLPINVYKIYYKKNAGLKSSTFYVKVGDRVNLQTYFKKMGYKIPIEVS